MKQVLTSLFLKPINFQPYSNVYGLSRSALALGTLLTLLFNSTEILFSRNPDPLMLTDSPLRFGLSLYSVFSPNYEAVRYLSIAILILAGSGWRPRLTAIPHWWVSFSLSTSGSILEGGDQITSILTFLMLPICLTDSRKWHWSTPPTMSQGNISFVEDISRFAAFASYQLIRIQVFYVYFNAAISKFKIIEWLNGTAIYYYWLTNPYMGANDFIQPIIRPLVTSRIFTPLLTWGAIVFELILAFAFVLQPKSRQPLLIFAVSFHLVIAVVHGLIPFCLAMTGALILYLRPLDNQFNFNIVSRPFLNIRANQ